MKTEQFQGSISVSPVVLTGVTEGQREETRKLVGSNIVEDAMAVQFKLDKTGHIGKNK